MPLKRLVGVCRSAVEAGRGERNVPPFLATFTLPPPLLARGLQWVTAVAIIAAFWSKPLRFSSHYCAWFRIQSCSHGYGVPVVLEV